MQVEAHKSRQHQNRAVLSITLMLLGLALYPLADALIQHLIAIYSVPQAIFLRSSTRAIPLLIATFFYGGPLRVLGSQYPGRHAARLAVNLAYTFAFMYALSFGSLTTVYALSYTSPFFMILLSALLLQEPVGRKRWAAVAIGMVGVLVALRPGTTVLEITALLVLAGSFLGALNKILMRRLAETEHSLAIVIYPNLMMIAVTLPFLVTTWEPMPWIHWGLFAIVGVLAAAGQYCIAQALRFAQGSVLAPIEYSSFFWVVALDYLFRGSAPDIYTLIGVVIIVGSNLYILYRTHSSAATQTVR